ncbi:MAG: hypothetical protein AB9866_29845 [Syntrophobacteraceae bacterium]
MDMLHKKGAEPGRRGSVGPHRLESSTVDLEPDENAEDADSSEQISVKPGRELIEVSRQGARCYRLEKTRCGKKTAGVPGESSMGPIGTPTTG